jgi:hypothetical protein
MNMATTPDILVIDDDSIMRALPEWLHAARIM